LNKNLTGIITSARSLYPDIQIIVAGMQMPASMGTTYQKSFEAVYRDVAQANKVILIPFLLQGVASDSSLNQSDRIHPTAEGQLVIADTVWPYLLRALGKGP